MTTGGVVGGGPPAACAIAPPPITAVPAIETTSAASTSLRTPGTVNDPTPLVSVVVRVGPPPLMLPFTSEDVRVTFPAKLVRVAPFASVASVADREGLG